MKTKPRRKRTRTLAALDKKYLWHPFTQMKEWIEDEEIIIIEKARGCYLIDTDGNKYLDGVSSLWCNIHGHKIKKLDRAIRKQLALVAHSTMLGLANPPAIKLARMLVEIAPEGLSRVFYSDDGATSVEAALKMCFQFFQNRGEKNKTAFAALHLAYHGDTMGSVSLGGLDAFHGLFSPLKFNVFRIPAPYCYRCPLKMKVKNCNMDCGEVAEKTIKQNRNKIAGFVIEPLVQGASGIIVHPKGYLKEIARICRENDVKLIADEVATGFGRTGKIFACHHENVSPDFLCLAKGISGGYLPVAATLTTEEIFNQFLGSHESGKAFAHGHTYTGNPLGCAVSIASLKLLKTRILPRLNEKIEAFGQLLDKKIRPLSHVGDVRFKGLMAGIELVEDKTTKKPYPASRTVGKAVARAIRKHGVILRPLGEVIVLMPPLSITVEEIEFLIEKTALAIKEITES